MDHYDASQTPPDAFYEAFAMAFKFLTSTGALSPHPHLTYRSPRFLLPCTDDASLPNLLLAAYDDIKPRAAP
ncbi:hypothetical protein R3P38DRAFT_3229953 [Favolaschia claudopus]|uniref:Uncharacterized protein n=1 Tax=Favolaschia claudopus TaxID=2862362 RepID=A0AAV9ZMU5_9AGAR